MRWCVFPLSSARVVLFVSPSSSRPRASYTKLPPICLKASAVCIGMRPVDSTITQNMCSEYPKHPRSCPGSTLDPNAARIRSHTFSATAHRCKSHTRTSDAPVPDSGQDAHHAAHHRAQLRKSAPELPEITGWLHRAGKIERWTCCTRLSNRRCIARATRARRALFRSTRRGSRAACCTSLYATMHARIQTAQIAGCSNRTGVRELEGAHVVLEKSLVDEAKHKTTYEQEGSGHFAGEWRQL